MSITVENKKKDSKNLFQEEINGLIVYQKNDILKKAIYLFLIGKYNDSLDYMYDLYPEFSLNQDSNALLLMGHIHIRFKQLDSAMDFIRQSIKMLKKDEYFVYDSLSIIYFLKKDYDTAIKTIQDITVKNFYYYYHLGLYHEAILNDKLNNSLNKDNIELIKQKGNNQKIIDFYESALKLNKNSFKTLLNLGSIYASENDFIKAEKYFQNALKIKEDDWRINLNLAFLNTQKKDYSSALNFFEKTILLLNNKIDLRILEPYMICLYKEKDWKKLEEVCKRILKRNKKHKKALVFLVEALKYRKEYKQLSNLFNKLKLKIKKVKNDNKKRTQSFNSHYESIKKKVKIKLKEMEEIKKANSESAKQKALELRYLQDFVTISKLNKDDITSFGFKEDEIKTLIQVYNQNENSIEALYNLALINFKVENYDKSLEFFLKVHELNSNYEVSTVCGCLGDILLFNKKPKEALEYFCKSLKEETDNELLEVKIGICYELIDEFNNALEHYKKSYELNKEFPASIFHIGAIYDRQNNPEAIKWFELAYEKEKENVQYLRKYGDILVRKNDKDSIEKGILILERGLEFFNGNVDIMSSLAIGYEKKGKLKDAIHLLELASNKESFFNNKSKVFQMACYNERAKNFTKAVEQFKRVLFLDKNNTEALLHIGFIYKSCKEYVKAFKCFNRIISNDPRNPHAYYGLGKLYQSMNDMDDEAFKNYNKCIEIEPNYLKALIQLGVLFLKHKNFDKSLEILDKVYELDKNNALCLTCLGNIYIEKKEFEKAEEYLLKSIKLDKNNIATNSALADVYFAKEKYEDAIQKYLNAIKLGGKLPEIYLNLAHCYYIKDKYELSINNYINALKIVKNTRHDYYYYLGNALVAGKRYKDAIKAYQAAIKLKNNKLLYYFVLGRACYLDNQFKSGIKYLEELIDIKNKLNIENNEDFDDKDALFLLFKCYSSLPSIDQKKCKYLISELMKDDPKNVKYINCLAILYEKTNQTFEAMQAYKKILKIDPYNMAAKKDLKDLEDRAK